MQPIQITLHLGSAIILSSAGYLFATGNPIAGAIALFIWAL
jgi:hypothetical protein